MKNINVYINRDNTPYLVRDGADYNLPPVCNQAARIYEAAKELKHDCLAEEKCIAYYLDIHTGLIAFAEVSHGSSTDAPINIPGILRRALLVNAHSIIFTHNHPSGDWMPSANDISATNALKEACTAINIPLLDHIIISRDGYYSFAENGGM